MPFSISYIFSPMEAFGELCSSPQKTLLDDLSPSAITQTPAVRRNVIIKQEPAYGCTQADSEYAASVQSHQIWVHSRDVVNVKVTTETKMLRVFFREHNEPY